MMNSLLLLRLAKARQLFEIPLQISFLGESLHIFGFCLGNRFEARAAFGISLLELELRISLGGETTLGA
jgi:hypothetical protein